MCIVFLLLCKKPFLQQHPIHTRTVSITFLQSPRRHLQTTPRLKNARNLDDSRSTSIPYFAISVPSPPFRSGYIFGFRSRWTFAFVNLLIPPPLLKTSFFCTFDILLFHLFVGSRGYKFTTISYFALSCFLAILNSLQCIIFHSVFFTHTSQC